MLFRSKSVCKEYTQDAHCYELTGDYLRFSRFNLLNVLSSRMNKQQFDSFKSEHESSGDFDQWACGAQGGERGRLAGGDVPFDRDAHAGRGARGGLSLN